MVLPPTPIGVAHGGESQAPSTMSEAGGNGSGKIRVDENKDIIVQRDFVSHFSTTTNASFVGSFVSATGGPGTVTVTSPTAAHRVASTVPNGFDELFELYERY